MNDISHKEMSPTHHSFEEANIGMSIPSLVKKPTTVSVFMFCAATWVTHRVHFDQDFARSVGLKNVLVPGPLQIGYLIQMITDWLGDNCAIRKLSYRHHASAFPGDVLTCTGRITGKRRENENGYLDLNLSIENQDRQSLVSGTATVCVFKIADR